MSEHSPYTDQEDPPVGVTRLVAEYDNSEPYEVDQGAVFETENSKYIGVVISGCS